MRKSLLLVALLVGTLFSSVQAQRTFEAPDTICVRQPVQLLSKVSGKASHYWGFCSGYLYNDPTGTNLGSSFQFDAVTGIQVAKNDDGNYYGFVTNVGSGGPDRQTLLRLDYGSSLDNTPTVTSFGNMDGILPADINSICLVRDQADSNWYLFVTAGTIVNTSTLARIDFGRSLANTPNIVNFGNLENQLADPTGVFVTQDDDKQWHGFFINRLTNQIKRFDMGDNISLTPSIVTVTTAGAPLLGANDLAPVKDDGKWYFFITNGGANQLLRIDMDSLKNITPTSNVITNGWTVALDVPSAMTIVKDCDRLLGFFTNKGTHELIRVEMNSGAAGPYTATNFSTIGGILSPDDITNVIRDRDNVYAFITNQADNSLTQIKFGQCTRTNIKSSLTEKPPMYYYDTAGLYNVYYATNEGMPDAEVECKQIRVLPIPPMIVTPDTIICQGDTATLRVLSINAISFTWSPNYNVSSTSKNEIKVWPDFTNKYTVRMPFPFGTCVVDTSFNVEVRKVKADAGPDRTIADGASTMLGGPNTMTDPQFLRRWSPEQYIDDIFSDNPTVRPPNDFTYYLTVTDSSSPNLVCVDVDTVIVHVECEAMNLPNAFMPESVGPRSRFGLLNAQIVKLDRFSVFDRWGKEVFTTSDPTKQWDGTINGEKAAVGVYIWEAVGFCNSGKFIQKTGNVMLIR